MTDPDLADATYLEPITSEVVTKTLERERPNAILPTMGGQTGLNIALGLHRKGVLEALEVELIGARSEAIEKAEDRQLFRAGDGTNRSTVSGEPTRHLARGGP